MSGRAPRNRPRAGSGRGPGLGRALFLVALAALAIRLVYLSGATQSPLFLQPALDARVNDAQAWAMASGAGSGGPAEPYFRPPLYGAFFAAIYSVAGHDLSAPRVAQTALGVGTVLLLGLIGATLWDRRVGIAAAAIGALYAPAIYFEGELVSATLELFLAALALWLLLEGAKRRSEAWLAGAGLALAAGAVTRPTILPFALLAVVWLWKRVPARTAAIFLAAVLSLPVAATVRNVVVARDPVFIASQGGVNFYIGNHDDADGTTPRVPGLGSGVTATYDAPFREASRLAERPLRASEVSAFWFGRGFEYWSREPLDAAWLTARKIAMVWNRRELPNTQDQAFFGPYNSWLFRAPLLLGFAVIAPIALAAAWFERRRAGVLVLYAGALTIATAVFFVCDRFRLPLAAAVIPLAGAGLVRAWDWWRGSRPGGSSESGGPDRAGRLRRAAPVASALMAAAAFVWLPFPKWQAVEEGMSWFRIATAHEQAGDARSAGGAYARAERAGLNAPEFWNNYGLHALRVGDLDAAVARFRRAVEIDASHGPALGNLAEAYLRREEWSLAAGAYAAAAGAMPERAAELMTNAGALYHREGKLDAARQAYKIALAAVPGFDAAEQGMRALGEEPGGAAGEHAHHEGH
ncbi:MAG TPA: tetratricopeptide repeat protein [Candidatus Eisenbacteria bacterium]|nr:tetratricopeptide repeat protein [Candidatus Eisenbacteria bacterium]